MATTTHFYSASQTRFYAATLEPVLTASESWPVDAVPVSYDTVLAFQSSEAPDGMNLAADAAGLPCWAPIFDDETRLLRAEIERDAYLRVAVDAISRLEPTAVTRARIALPNPELDAWLNYLTALNATDLTVVPVQWPEKP